jgi:hypothetical protein
MQWWIFVIAGTAGAVGQLLDSISGMGFGAVTSTTLIAAGGSTGVVVAAINISKITAGAVSGFTHWKLGNVRKYWLTPLAVAGVLGGITGALLLTRLPNDLSPRVTPWLLILMALLIIRKYVMAVRDAKRATISGGATADVAQPSSGLSAVWKRLRRRTRAGMSGIGFVAGFLNAWTGAYGPFATSAVMLVQTGHPRYVVGTVNTSEMFVAAAVAVTLVANLDMTPGAWLLAGVLTAGSVITAPVGALLAKRFQARSLGLGIAFVLIAVNAFTLFKAYS